MNKSTCFFQLAYEGSALDDHRMNVEDLAPSLLALGKLVNTINNSANNGQFQASLSVNANFKKGSFLVDLIVNQDWGSWVATLTSQPMSAIVNAYALLCIIRDIINLKKFLKGQKATKVEINNDNQTVKVYLNQSVISVNFYAYELYKKEDIRTDCEKFVAPLNKDGIDAIRFTYQGESMAEIQKDDLTDFLAKEEDEPLSESIHRSALQIESLAFRDTLKWKVSNGNNSFYVAMEDNDFIAKIKSRTEAFREGDILIVDLKDSQFLRNGKVVAENSIVKVIEHRSAPIQTELDFPKES